MYSVVLAAFLTTGDAAPDFGRRRGGRAFYSAGCCGCRGGYGGWGGCYGGWGASYGCGGGGGYYGGGGYQVVGYSAGYGSGTPAGGTSQSASAGGGGNSQEVQDLKRALEELRQQQTKQRLEALKQTAGDLRLEAVERSLRDLRRAVEQTRPVRPPSPLPPRGAPPVPLPPPKSGGSAAPVALPPPKSGEQVPPVALPPPKSGDAVPAGLSRADAARAGVTVRLPADAELFVDGVRCPLPTDTRTFDTPPLEGTGRYYYTLRAEVLRDGRRLTETRRIDFRPGQHVTVSFDQLGQSEPSEPGGPAARAGVTVRLPADAELFVDGVRCPLPTDTRTFDTPPLEGTGRYYYTLRAEVLRDGRRLTETRRVDLRPGQHVTVSFDQLGERVAALR